MPKQTKKQEVNPINLTDFFNSNKQTHIISDYEGEQIPEQYQKQKDLNLLICGDILDSTVGVGGDDTQMPVDGSVGKISKVANLYNIYQITENPQIKLILGNRDLIKLKCIALCKIKYKKGSTEINNFNQGNINLSYDTYTEYKNLIKKNEWLANVNNWLPFWNNTTLDSTSGDNYNRWHENYNVSTAETPFLDRFNRIFGRDTAKGTMSADNLLYTIPMEIFEIPSQNNQNYLYKTVVNKLGSEFTTNMKDIAKDYLAFIVISVFNAGFNNYDKKNKDYKSFDENENLTDTYINGLFYRFFNEVGKKINFLGYADLENKLYLFSHGGITADLINNPDVEELKKIIHTNKDKITNIQHGGATDTNNSFDKQTIVNALKTCNDALCELVQNYINGDNSFYICIKNIIQNNIDLAKQTYIPPENILLLLSLSALYKPDNKELFVLRSPINPGVVNMLTSPNGGFVCSDAELTQIFGHIPKGFGPTFFTLHNKENDRKSYIINLDMSQSFKYFGNAGKTDVKVGYNQAEFKLFYTLDFSKLTQINDKPSLEQIIYKNENQKDVDNGKYIVIGKEEDDKIFKINTNIKDMFEKAENIQTSLNGKIPQKNVILYHGFDQKKNVHIFSLSDGITSHNKVLVLYKENESSGSSGQQGGYYEKYMKYKAKYIALKNRML